LGLANDNPGFFSQLRELALRTAATHHCFSTLVEVEGMA